MLRVTSQVAILPNVQQQDAVEELQAEASHQRQAKRKTSLEQYCDANPEADECRVYED